MLAPQRGLIATGQNQNRHVVRCRLVGRAPDTLDKAHSRKCQTSTATPAEPGDLLTELGQKSPSWGTTRKWRRCDCRDKSASRQESAALPHLAGSLFPRTYPAWAVRRAVLSCCYVYWSIPQLRMYRTGSHRGETSETREPKAGGDLTAGNSCGEAGVESAGPVSWLISRGRSGGILPGPVAPLPRTGFLPTPLPARRRA